ncbi:uncharacterized protein LOC115583846 [Sparus aurata]|uniref:uncharacterized protein LOC115583846 n=1 Tax=Sparus aurata TaxID=8175 RepID=UPI0011C0E585|nr:uncharacterized protein LOC115583846 [Sparus aurata]
MVPEAYRQRFRKGKKEDKQSYLEFSRDIVNAFNRWKTASGVKTFEDLCDLLLLEQFKNAVPNRIATYVTEQQVKTVGEAAALADQYDLTHNSGWGSARGAGGFRDSATGQVLFSAGAAKPEVGARMSGWNDMEKVCHFCHKKGHVKADCYALQKRNKQMSVKPAAFAASAMCVSDMPDVHKEVPVDVAYLPFVSSGYVSLSGSSEKVPVTILRDTGALDSFILASVLPFSGETDTGDSVLVLGMGLVVLSAPLHRLNLFSDLVQGEVTIGVRPALPVKGVHIILGNGLAGGRVWPNVPPLPVVNPVSTSDGPDECERTFPDVFPACVVTRAGARAGGDSDKVSVMEAPCMNLSDFPLSVSRAELVAEQQSDPSIRERWEVAGTVADVKDRAHGYFLEKGVLVRKWVPCNEVGVGHPLFQVVVPAKFRKLVLQVSHDQSGHQGVRKTYDRILRYFFWPRLKKDVSEYIKSCHTCQITGKPNQVIKPAPLHPIPAIGEPFEHIIIDCVGPLPPSRSGAKYLLTVMCQATRYPAAYPLRSITTRLSRT